MCYVHLQVYFFLLVINENIKQEKNNLKQAMYDEAHDALQQLQTENQQLQVQVFTQLFLKFILFLKK